MKCEQNPHIDSCTVYKVLSSLFHVQCIVKQFLSACHYVSDGIVLCLKALNIISIHVFADD